MLCRIGACAALGLGALAPAAAARPQPQPLARPAPAHTAFADRVLHGPARAHAAQAGPTVAFPTREGYSVAVTFSPAYGVRTDVGATYVALLDSLPHGRELADLKMTIAPPAQVRDACGGAGDVVACYDATSQRMIVPGEELAPAGVSTAYVITHEYGHHVARNRSNAPLRALDFGPKYWSSEAMICHRTARHRLSPGNEDLGYRFNPGENWAEVYARLTYPDAPWTFAPLLRPDAAALAAARRDVLDPWHGLRRRTFRGRFTRRGSDVRRFRVPLHLDGAFRATLRGARGSDLRLAVRSNGRLQGRTRERGARQQLRFGLACRAHPRETARLTVTRRAGSGRFRLVVRYAG